MPKSLVVLALCAFTWLPALPAIARGVDPTPSPLPINGVTVDVHRRHGAVNVNPGDHVERPFGPHGTPRHGRNRPVPTPTPKP